MGPEGEKKQNNLNEFWSAFYLSFRYSQGAIAVQLFFFSWLRDNGYFAGINFPDAVGRDFKVPKRHKNAPELNMNEHATFESVYGRLKHILNAGEDDWSHIASVEECLKQMVEADINYQKLSRKGRVARVWQPDSDDDPHASMVRKYIILGTQSGHKGLNDLFGRMKEVVDNQGRLEELAGLWQANHPGLDFYNLEK